MSEIPPPYMPCPGCGTPIMRQIDPAREWWQEWRGDEHHTPERCEQVRVRLKG